MIAENDLVQMAGHSGVAVPDLVAGPPAGSSSPPPFANRGVATLGGQGECEGGSVDYLTVTVNLKAARHLLEITKPDEPGYPVSGFARSEHRLCLGGDCWRRFEPRQDQRELGRDYESWEWPGPQAHHGIDALVNRWARPSRVDIAFDFVGVAADFMADDVAEMIREHVADRGLSRGVSGQDDWNTRYVGGPSSPRRVRIYRKDRTNPMSFPEPTMRVELVLKGDRACEWWAKLLRDRQLAFDLAAAHLLDMTGLVVPAVQVVPVQSIPADVRAESERLNAFLAQYAVTVSTWDRLGIPLLELCHARAESASRFSRCRQRQRERRIDAEGLRQVVELAGGLGDEWEPPLLDGSPGASGPSARAFYGQGGSAGGSADEIPF